MSAIDNLLRRLESLDQAVTALASGSISDSAISEHLARGIAVHGLVCIETFLKERMQEWSAAMTMARVPAQTLPGGTIQYENRIIEVLPRRLRDAEYSESVQRSALLEEIGRSLTSLYSGTLVPHHFAFMWAGSNVQGSDVEAIVSLVTANKGDSVWRYLTGIWSSVDKYFPGNTSLRTVFDQVCQLRHAAAHQSAPSLPLLNLRSTTRNVKLVCLCVDVAVSAGLQTLTATSNATAQGGPGRVPIRRVVRMGSKWREFGPGRKNATRRHASLETAMREAISRARAAGELVLILDEQEDILDWRLYIN